MSSQDDFDWHERWGADRAYVTRAAIEWATGIVAAGTPPMLVSEALAEASEAVQRGIDANFAALLDWLRTQEPTS